MGEEALTCKSCNEAVTAETVFCPGCGEQLREPPKEKVKGKGGKLGLVVGLAVALLVLGGGGAAAAFMFGLFDTPPPVQPPPPPPSTGPSPADIKKAADVRNEVGMALRDKLWDTAEQKLGLARMLHPDHEDNERLAQRIRVGRAKELFDEASHPLLQTPDSKRIDVPACYRAAVKMGGATVAMIVTGESFATDTVLVAASVDATQRWKKAVPLEGENASLRALAVTYDGDSIVLGGTDGRLRLVALLDGRDIDSVEHPGTVVDLAVARNNKNVVAMNEDGAATVFTLDPLSRFEAYAPAEGARPVMALDPKNQWMVLGGATELRVITFGSPSLERKIPIDGTNLVSLAVSPEGETIAAAASDGRVRFFESKSGKAVGEGSVGDLTQILYDPSGRMIMVWHNKGGTLRYLTTPSLDAVAELDTGMQGLTWIGASANGGDVVVTGRGKTGASSTYAVYRLLKSN